MMMEEKARQKGTVHLKDSTKMGRKQVTCKREREREKECMHMKNKKNP